MLPLMALSKRYLVFADHSLGKTRRRPVSCEFDVSHYDTFFGLHLLLISRANTNYHATFAVDREDTEE